MATRRRVFASLFNHLINHIVRSLGRRFTPTENKSMALLSPVRKLVGFALAMLIIATSVQPVQAQFRSGEFRGHWLTSNSTTADSHGILDTVLYISEESEGQTGRKGSSQRLGTGDPVAVEAAIPLANPFSLAHDVPSYRAVDADSGLFLSPLKTGPPAL